MLGTAPFERVSAESKLAMHLQFLLLGSVFGVILIKAEVVSWYRIQEMFRFQSFHMYGVIGSAVIVGVLSLWLIRKLELNSFSGQRITLKPKVKQYKANLIGGSIFGLGWALVGACPGPIIALIGAGSMGFALVLLSAILGTFVYGQLRQYLPH